MKKILVSKCLYGGDIVRYDAGDVTEKDPRFLKWKEEGRLIPICPEVFGGLKVPRPDSQRIGKTKVMSQTGIDVTEEYTKGAKEVLRLNREEGLNLRKISEIVNIPERRLGELCKLYNLDVKRNFIYKVVDTFFDNIDCEIKAYLLGYFIADGNM